MAIVTTPESSTIAVTGTLVQFNPTSQLPLKLTGSSTFTTWKAQLEMLLHGHDLYGYLDGSVQTPSQTITETNKTIPNPEYKFGFARIN